MDMKNLVEVLLFASPEPLTQTRFNHIIQVENTVELGPIIDALNSEYKKSGNYEKDSYDLTLEINKTIEKMTLKRPEQWLWLHNRWK